MLLCCKLSCSPNGAKSQPAKNCTSRSHGCSLGFPRVTVELRFGDIVSELECGATRDIGMPWPRFGTLELCQSMFGQG